MENRGAMCSAQKGTDILSVPEIRVCHPREGGDPITLREGYIDANVYPKVP